MYITKWENIMTSYGKIFKALFRPNQVSNVPVKYSLSEKTWQCMSKNIFRDSTSQKSRFLEFLSDFEMTLRDNSINMPEDVLEAYSKLSYKANLFADRMSISISKGLTPQCGNNDMRYYYYEKFMEANVREFNILKRYIYELRQTMQNQVDAGKGGLEVCEKIEALANDLSLSLSSGFERKYSNISSYLSRMYDPRISEVDLSIVNPSQYFYHGTHAKRQILKEGFSLLPKEKQIERSAREIGKAVYLTPDKEVAAFFAGSRGDIIKTKTNIGKIAVMNEEQAALINREIDRVFGKLGSNNALREEVTAELFKRNGFDAVYTKQCLNDTFSKLGGNDIDGMIGHAQTQVAVFDPNNITICKKSIKEKLSDKILQIKMRFCMLNNV